MAISVVKATRVVSSSGTNASASVSATASNALIVPGAIFLGNANDATYTVTRSGDTYTIDIDAVDTNSSSNLFLTAISSAPNIAGGAVSLTVAGAGSSGVSAYAMEVSGLPTSNIRDATSPAQHTGNSTSASTNALANVTADAIFVAVNGSNSGANPATETPGGSFSDNANGTTMKETNGASVEVMDASFLIVSSVASQTATWTVSSAEWAAVIAVYKASGVAVPSISSWSHPLSQPTSINDIVSV